MLLHVHSLASTPLVLLDKLDKLVNHTRPSRVLAPEAQAVVLERLRREAERLVPHVLVDASFVARVKELEPPVQPGRI